jgi:hypothetical protein
MRRGALRVFAAVSALAALCVVAAWARSYSYLDSFKRYSSVTQRFEYAVLLRGGLQIARCNGLPESRFGEGVESTELPRSLHGSRGDNWQILTGWGTLSYRSFAGFRVARGDLNYKQTGSSPAPFWSLRVPLYAPLVVTLLLPAWWVRTFIGNVRRRRRARANRCEACGFDLRGTPERCPECGRPVPAAAPALA